MATCSGLPSSKAAQLCLGLGSRGSRGAGGAGGPGLCPRLLCGSPCSTTAALSQQQCPGRGTGILQPRQLSDHGGSIPVSTARNPLEGATAPTHKDFAGLFQGDPAWSCKADFLCTHGFWQQLEEPWHSPCASVPAAWQVLCECPPPCTALGLTWTPCMPRERMKRKPDLYCLLS